ncbi:MAG: IS4 family transposase [Rickettsiaceae bacterium]|nr:IS4 family transposase [Rickettsiaceae bacterium]
MDNSNEQKTAANILQIIYPFVTGIRKDKSLLIAWVVFQIISLAKVGLYHIAIKLNNNVKLTSNEQRLRRLLDKLSITKTMFAKAIFKLFNFKDVELIMDRTNWKFGKTSINFLTLSVNWKNLAIPIYWIMLNNKGGNSNSDQRIHLIKWFIDIFGNERIVNLYADREFASVKFIKWLLESKVNFLFRTKSSIKASDGDKSVCLSKLFYNLNNLPNKTRIESKIRRIFGARLFISARLNNKNEQIFIISNQYYENSFELYIHRWSIENMFGKFKIKGFNLESTHITKVDRLSNLFMLIAVAYSYSCIMGEIRASLNPPKIKNLRQADGSIIQCSEFSIFKYGFYLLKNLIDNHIYYDDLILIKQLTNLFNNASSYSFSERTRLYQIITRF